LYFWSNVNNPQNIEHTKGTKQNQEGAKASLIAKPKLNKQQHNNIFPSLFNWRQGLIISD